MRSGVTITRDEVDRVVKQVRELTTQVVLVGIPEAEDARQPDPDEDFSVTNALLGYVHENGSPERNIPARPFLVPGIEAALPQIVPVMQKGAAAAMAGKADASQVLGAVGTLAQSAVQQKITQGPFEPLAPKTLAKRRAKGRTGIRPLIDTGQLRRAINFVIRKK